MQLLFHNNRIHTCTIDFIQKLLDTEMVAEKQFWSGNLFLFAPFSDFCLLVPFFS